MATLDAVNGATLEDVHIDEQGHQVKVTLRTREAHNVTDHTLVLQGVTDFSFADHLPGLNSGTTVASVDTEHDTESIRLTFSFGSEAAALTLSCAKVVLRRNRQPE
ncbi:hypothetical protein [Salinactinospora qingdaonensis]|uniref:Uncharacterized protein n=1 Tax=Salinactinospora qingdaonensis TaxID=702744 RepID=A0ABP7FKP4_9ACTN